MPAAHNRFRGCLGWHGGVLKPSAGNIGVARHACRLGVRLWLLASCSPRARALVADQPYAVCSRRPRSYNVQLNTLSATGDALCLSANAPMGLQQPLVSLAVCNPYDVKQVRGEL